MVVCSRGKYVPVLLRYGSCRSLLLILLAGCVAAAENTNDRQTQEAPGIRPFSRVGLRVSAGLGGAGVETATPLGRTLDLRAGSDFFVYNTTLQEDSVNVGLKLRMQASRASMDWFPRGGRFKLSPLLVFANNNHVGARVTVPSSDDLTLGGQQFVSSSTDPLRGSASVDFRRVSPGATIGLGRMFTPERHHWSFSTDAGFYYAGVPPLKIAFNGSACAATAYGSACEAVTKDPVFQQSLAAFEAKSRRNLRYASYFPILTTGIGYAF